MAFLVISFAILAFVYWRFANPWRSERIADMMGPELPFYAATLMLVTAIEPIAEGSWLNAALRLAISVAGFWFWFRERQARRQGN